MCFIFYMIFQMIKIAANEFDMTRWEFIKDIFTETYGWIWKKK